MTNPTPQDVSELIERLHTANLWLSAHYDDDAEEHGCAIEDAITILSAQSPASATLGGA